MSKRKKRRRKYTSLFVALIMLIIVGLFMTKYVEIKQRNFVEFQTVRKKLQETNQLVIYNRCLNIPYKSDQVDSMFNELINKLSSNSISIYFEELQNDYTLAFNENKSYYGASIVKLFMASYLIDNARLGLIDMNDTITYTSADARIASFKLEKHSVGEDITIKTLLDYSISASDNAAYAMLANYVGVDNFKEYVKNTFNINLTINDNNLYSYLKVTDTNTLLHHIFDIINGNDEYSVLLKDAMNNTYYNGINFDNITFLHKYGYYSTNYHNIGIYDSDNPYFISIFTLYGKADESHLSKMSEISKEIYNIYQNNLTEKEMYCYNLAYN